VEKTYAYAASMRRRVREGE